MGSKSKVCVIAIVLIACVSALEGKNNNVVIGFYSESLCPDCIAFSNGPLTDAFKEVCVN